MNKIDLADLDMARRIVVIISSYGDEYCDSLMVTKQLIPRFGSLSTEAREWALHETIRLALLMGEHGLVDHSFTDYSAQAPGCTLRLLLQAAFILSYLNLYEIVLRLSGTA